MEKTKISIGFFAVGLKPYWAQFEGMKEKCTRQHEALAQYFDESRYSVTDMGIIDSEKLAREAGRAFKREDVQIVFCQMLTYAASEYIAPAVRELDVPVVLLNIQCDKALDLQKVKSIGNWLSEGITCAGIPEATAVLRRMDKRYDVLTGHMENDAQSLKGIAMWCEAARIKARLANSNVGMFGRPYGGMMDLCIDETLLFTKFGCFVHHLDWTDIINSGKVLSEAGFAEQKEKLNGAFHVGADISGEDIECIARTAGGLKSLADDYDLCAVAAHYETEAPPSQTELVAALNPAMTMLMTEGIACAPEGDIKSALAMVVLRELAGSAMTAELYSMDFDTNTCLVGHSGACDAAISDERATLKTSNVFHGKKGRGYVTQFKPRLGTVTMLALTQDVEGEFRFIAAEGECVEGKTLQFGDTNMRVAFPGDLHDFVNEWCMEGPTHHGVIGSGLHIDKIRCIASALNIELKCI